jgi:hypothetical protein
LIISSELIIRKLSIPHCARGPTLCVKCREAAKAENYALVKIYYEPGMITRPVMEIIKNGKKFYCEFDVLKVFQDELEVKDYAKKNSIRIIT